MRQKFLVAALCVGTAFAGAALSNPVFGGGQTVIRYSVAGHGLKTNRNGISIPSEGSTVAGVSGGEGPITGKLNTSYGWESDENTKWQQENDGVGYRTLSKVGSAISFTAKTEATSARLKSVSINTSAFFAEQGGSHLKPRVNCGTAIPANDSVNSTPSSTEVELTEAATETHAVAISCTLENAVESVTGFGAWAASSIKGGYNDTFTGHEAGHNTIYGANDTCLGFRTCVSIGGTGGQGNEDVMVGAEAGHSLTTASSNDLLIGTNVNPISGNHSNEFAEGSGSSLMFKGVFGAGEAQELKILPNGEGKISFYGATPIVQPHVGAAAAETTAANTTLVNKLRSELIAEGLVRE